MSVTRYEPWSLHRDLWSEMGRALERMQQSDDASSSATADWVPPVDIEESKDKFVIYADVPGIDPSSIDVTLENGVLTLSGSREDQVEQQGAPHEVLWQGALSVSVVEGRASRVAGRTHLPHVETDVALPVVLEDEDSSRDGIE